MCCLGCTAMRTGSSGCKAACAGLTVSLLPVHPPAGASGLVIEPGAAQELGLQAFGEFHVTGMAGKVRSNFR